MLILQEEKQLCREDIQLMKEVKSSLYINFSFEFSIFHLTGVALAIYIKIIVLIS